MPQNSHKILGMWAMSHRTYRKCSGMFRDVYPYPGYCSDGYTEVTELSQKSQKYRVRVDTRINTPGIPFTRVFVGTFPDSMGANPPPVNGTNKYIQYNNNDILPCSFGKCIQTNKKIYRNNLLGLQCKFKYIYIYIILHSAGTWT